VGVQEIQLKAQVPTFRLRILIKAVYSLGANGGSFNILGVSCNNPDLLLKNKSSPKSSLEELFGKTPPPPIYFKCNDTVASSVDLETRQARIGDTDLEAVCMENCLAEETAKV